MQKTSGSFFPNTRLKALCGSMSVLAVTALAVFYFMWDGKQEYQAFFLAGSALCCALIALVFVVYRILIRPLSKMVDAVKEMGESGLVGRIPENNGSVEINSLARLINGLQ
ncbi:MAG: HAMP domain-containing protein, partial [Pseudomonadota bacterium]|nr:HAMP domain-containing protein [Pseudomonadota bacterium]